MAAMDRATAISEWNLTLPPTLVEAAGKLAPGEAIGVWELRDELLDPASLPPGGPVGLFAIGEDGMGDYLCLAYDPLTDADPIVVMWNPEEHQITRLGSEVSDFLNRECYRRVEFLLSNGAPLEPALAAGARKGEEVSLEAIAEDQRTVAELLVEVCRVAGKLDLDEAIVGRASGSPDPPAFLREVDGRDEPGIDDAISELRSAAEGGDGAAAIEVMGFLQIRQKYDELAKWAYVACRCSLFTWPGATPAMLSRVVEMLKKESAAIPAKERIDPLFLFLTSQPAGKVDGRLNLAKQYLRKKDFRGAAREAENALWLSQSLADATAAKTGMKSAYALLVEVFKSAGRPREEKYAQLMLDKLAE